MFGASDLKSPPSPKLQHQASDPAMNTFPKVPSGGKISEDSMEIVAPEEKNLHIPFSLFEEMQPSKLIFKHIFSSFPFLMFIYY